MPSKLRVIDLAATPGNSATDLAAPASGHKYRVLGWYIVLVCDATVANRYIYVNVYKAGTANAVFPIAWSAAAVTASATGSLWAGQYAAPGSGTAANQGGAASGSGLSLREGFLIDSAVTLNISITGGVAGDSYSGRLLVEDIAP